MVVRHEAIALPSNPTLGGFDLLGINAARRKNCPASSLPDADDNVTPI